MQSRSYYVYCLVQRRVVEFPCLLSPLYVVTFSVSWPFGKTLLNSKLEGITRWMCSHIWESSNIHDPAGSDLDRSPEKQPRIEDCQMAYRQQSWNKKLSLKVTKEYLGRKTW